MTAAGFRKIALELEGAVESGHMGHPDFRVGGKIFATLGYPDGSFAMVALTPDEQAKFTAAEPDVFVPVKGAWGARGATNVRLQAATAPIVRRALEAAWRRRAAAKSRPSRPRRRSTAR